MVRALSGVAVIGRRVERRAILRSIAERSQPVGPECWPTGDVLWAEALGLITVERPALLATITDAGRVEAAK